MPRRRLTSSLPTAVLAAAAALALAAPAGAQSPPLPGAPPGAGLDLPAPGSAPSSLAGSAVAISIDPAHPGPGLAATGAALDPRSRRITIPVTCAAAGRAELAVPVVSRKPLASARYACAGGAGIARLRVAAKAAARLVKRKRASAVVTLREGAVTLALPLALGARTVPASAGGGFWSDGLLQCTTEGQPIAHLVAPNWTATPATAISARAWLAWRQNGGGWHWVGSRGPGASAWTSWTATPFGVAQWLQPTPVPGVYALTPWTLGPVSVPLGSGTEVVGVFEAVYWWNGRPTHVWHYVRSSPSGADALETPCGF
jgi:hypothetical protein